MSLAWLKDAIDRHDFVTARDRAAEALAWTKGEPTREPEALYWAAVAAYKASDGATQLSEG